MSRTQVMFAVLAVVLGTASQTYAAGAPGSGTVSINLPPETASFKPGPNESVAQGKCQICHSADYIYMQPPLAEDTWKAEVEKMMKTYGCPVAPQEVSRIASYLYSQNGKH